MRTLAVALAAAGLAGVLAAPAARAEDGTYGRLEGDVTLSGEVGASETIGDEATRGESLAVRLGWLYLQSAGVVVQYNESFGIDAQPIARAVTGAIELRPLFIGRMARNLEQGPALFDLWLDAWSLDMGIYNLWRAEPFCPEGECHDYGMEMSVGTELPFFTEASTPFATLRAAVRWSLSAPSAAEEGPPVMGLITLAIGYHHLFDWGLVDLSDPRPP